MTPSPAISFYTTVTFALARSWPRPMRHWLPRRASSPTSMWCPSPKSSRRCPNSSRSRPPNLKSWSPHRSRRSQKCFKRCDPRMFGPAHHGCKRGGSYHRRHAPGQVLQSQPRADFAYGDILLNGKRVGGRPSPLAPWSLYLHGMGFCHGACATRRDFHDRYGYYDPAFRISMDFAVFMSAVARGAVMAK